ncbi:threonine--tRNA ligase [Patescibacteria group bacterium]|nr:threonine--tRNA ligase [Patescibacteria group bacterium]MBU4115920.1 threonine--tRNA ligase [Patescibacteria group bacterium]
MEKEQKIQNDRHSLSHLLAAAVLNLWPDTKITIGPAIENGFYYDFDFSSPISDKDLPKIEKKMKEILKKWDKFEKIEVSEKEAKEKFKDNLYKLELIDELTKDKQKITFYKSGDFVDLCGGGHVGSAKKINPDAFKLSRVAGAYWRGSEKNKMLTRIYGLAFETKKELDEYIKLQEEAEKRDHRKLGKDLGLFVFSEIVGKGLPLWTEKGAIIRRELENFIVEEELKRNYKHVYTPDIAKIDLYKKSGHYPYYKDSMYAPIKIDEEEFMLRPMTCPHHFELYLSSPKSYKDLPVRIAELAKLYRYEKSGELTGLMRVRSFCLADAHIICADDKQAKEEVAGALDLIEYISNIFGFKMGKNYWYRLSLGDRKDDKKYFKDDKAWEKAEKSLREVLKERKCTFVEAENEAAFYGPKIDIQMKNFSGKEDTAFTVQYDFVMPKRFNLIYTDSDGKEKETIVIHRSSIGAIERIVAILIEHYAGAFPFWLSPVQVVVIPISEKQREYALGIFKKLKEEGLRVELDESNETLGKKIRNSKLQKNPYMIIVGDNEVKNKSVTLESRNEESMKDVKLEEVIKKLKKEIINKK